jgi:divinyl chlorophyllide a 8-vinyl-reductase
MNFSAPSSRRRVLLLGATGTIGRATTRALVDVGHTVVAFGRRAADVAGVATRIGDVADPASLARHGFRGERFDAIVSCLASRTGSPADAVAVDRDAHLSALEAAKAAGVGQFVLLSAICVQRPRLAFQHAKLAFETALIESGLAYSIVRPTAYFKSLSGQVERVKAGKPFLLFGDGRLTACKPISDDDLARYIADCLTHPARRNRILPIGGPGPAITPREQAERLFELLGRPLKIKRVPVALMSAIVGGLAIAGRFNRKLADKAEFARIGRYYATESMLVWNEARQAYDADATPETGSETLFDFYERLVRGEAKVELGEHAVF